MVGRKIRRIQLPGALEVVKDEYEQLASQA
jgi:hypothetical protein